MEHTSSPACPHCKVSLRSLGQLPIRVGGANPGWHSILEELADLGETIKPLDFYRYEKSGRLEFYDHNFSLPNR